MGASGNSTFLPLNAIYRRYVATTSDRESFVPEEKSFFFNWQNEASHSPGRSLIRMCTHLRDLCRHCSNTNDYLSSLRTQGFSIKPILRCKLYIKAFLRPRRRVGVFEMMKVFLCWLFFLFTFSRFRFFFS